MERRLERAARQLQGNLEADALQAELVRLRREWHEPAKAEVKDQLLVDAVARARNIEVSEADIAERVQAIGAYGGSGCHAGEAAAAAGLLRCLWRVIY